MLELVKAFNFILAIDSYKAGHWEEMPTNVEKSYSVIVPRKPSKYADEIVAMGQTYVGHIMATVRITEDMIDEAEREINEQGYTFNRKGWERIARDYAGRLPLAVYGVEEGRVVKPQTPILGIINTDNHSAWLPASVETWTQGVMQKMSTVASICRVCRITWAKYIEMTGADMGMLDYKQHNFGNRATTPEDAIYAGIAHAALFLGSDCTEANGYIKKLYNTTRSYTSSVEATEHSTMCANSDAVTKDDSGAAAMVVKRLGEVVARSKDGIGIPVMSAVIDTYDSRRFVREYMGVTHKEEIMNSGGKLVARPDSGDVLIEPVTVALDLKEMFGYTTNAKGFDTVHPSVGVLQGDGVNVFSVEPILKSFVDKNLSMDNLVLGMGHGTTNFGSRDDFSFSMKAIADYDGQSWKRLKKEPKTDTKKASLSGLIRNAEINGNLFTYDALDNGTEYNFFTPSAGWQLYSQDGYKIYRTSFDDVRARATKTVVTIV
jgi:nicotinamide phosphoribosyltransferase